MKQYIYIIYTIIFIGCTTNNENKNYEQEKYSIDTLIVDSSKIKLTRNEDSLITPRKPSIFFLHCPCFENYDFTFADSIFSIDSNFAIVIYEKESEKFIDGCCRNLYKRLKFENNTEKLASRIDTSFNGYVVFALSENKFDSISTCESDGEGLKGVWILDYFDFINSYIMQEYGWEWVGYTIVNKRSGIRYNFDGMPIFSPDSLLIISSYENVYDGGAEIDIRRIKSDSIIKIHKIDWAGYENNMEPNISQIVWVNNNTAYFTSNKKCYLLKIENVP